MKVIVSVIVPVYNSEKYLVRCLESLINQTLKDIEIIVVNDGSIDDSINIANSYTEKDKRVKVINKVNGGVSSARNIGIRNSCGQYIAFVDSDDTIDPRMYELLVSESLIMNAELVICNILMLNIKNNERKIVFSKRKSFENTLIHNEIIMHSPCNKLISRDLITHHNIFFPEGIIMNEDMVFMFQIFHYATKYIFIKDCLYRYHMNDESCVHSLSARHIRSMKEATVAIQKFLIEIKSDRDYRNFIIWRKFASSLPLLIDINNRDIISWKKINNEIGFRYIYFPIHIITKIIVFCFSLNLNFIAIGLLKLRDYVKKKGN